MNHGNGTESFAAVFLQTQFWNNSVHTPSGVATGQHCNGGGNMVEKPMGNADATALGTAVLAPFPRAGVY